MDKQTVIGLFDAATSMTSETMYHAATIILSIAAALIGLGWGWYKLQEKATGSGFAPSIPKRQMTETEMLMGKMNL